MVRLKGAVRRNKPSRYSISIPHGTIKSKGENIIYLDKDISIPHGTIKSCDRKKFEAGIKKFQFHMVRLKGAASAAAPARSGRVARWLEAPAARRASLPRRERGAQGAQQR